VRVWQPRDSEALRVRLGNTPLAAWAEDDILHVLWRGQADEVHLAAGIQPQLWPVQGAMDLWEASVRIRRLAEAVITIAVLPRRADDDQGSQISDKLVWRGPQASALLPTAASLAGAITEQVLDSAALGAPRAVTVYHPPGQPAPLLGCVLADAIGAKPPRRVPAWLARLFVGEHGVVMMTESRGASNAKAKRELGWRPAYPSWRTGFRVGLGSSGATRAA
jgi:hypothetical protein